MVRVGSWVSQRKKHIFIALLVTVFSIAGAAAVIYETRPVDPGRQALLAAKATVSYPLYYPRQLPNGYHYKDGSMGAANGVVVFIIIGPKNQQMAVTEQAKPQGYDFSQLSGTIEFQTSLGSAYVEDFNNRTTGSIVADQTWIIANTYSPISADVMREILSSFQ